MKIESPIKEDDGTVFWQQGIKPLILERFPNCISVEEQEPYVSKTIKQSLKSDRHVSLRGFVDLPSLVIRIEQLASLRLSERVHAYVNDPNPSPGPFALAGYDIIALGSRSTSLFKTHFHVFGADTLL